MNHRGTETQRTAPRWGSPPLRLCASMVNARDTIMGTRVITLKEACHIAEKLDERIDAAYERRLESEAAVPAVWEEA